MIGNWWWRLVRFGFRLLYNEMAWSYDVVSWLASLGEWRAWQRAALPFIRGKRVLEVAHGPGHMLLALARAGFEVAGLDLSAAMGRQAQRRLREAGLTVPLVRGEVQALPFAAATFDTVLSTFPTAFIVERDTLASVHQVLKPDGRLIIVPEGHLTGRDIPSRFINWLYVITGQRSGAFEVDKEDEWPATESAIWQAFEAQMAGVGFRLQIEQTSLKRSAATVVVARKAES